MIIQNVGQCWWMQMDVVKPVRDERGKGIANLSCTFADIWENTKQLIAVPLSGQNLKLHPNQSIIEPLQNLHSSRVSFRQWLSGRAWHVPNCMICATLSLVSFPFCPVKILATIIVIIGHALNINRQVTSKRNDQSQPLEILFTIWAAVWLLSWEEWK